MSEYEYLDIITSMRDSGGFHAMNYIAILFAFLIASYSAGHMLSRFQAGAVTMFHMILCPMPEKLTIAAWEVFKEFSTLVLEYQTKFNPNEPIPLFVQYGPDLWRFTFIGNLALSIIFMVQARASRNSRESNAETILP